MPIYRLIYRNMATGKIHQVDIENHIALWYHINFITNAFRVEGINLSSTKLVSRKGLKADLTSV